MTRTETTAAPEGRGSRSASSRAARLALVGLLANIGLAAGKLLAGIVGNSYALVADAVESLGDLLGSAVIWGGLHIGSRPADEDHPYGHGKAESLAGLVVGLMVLLAGAAVAVKAVEVLLTPPKAPEAWTLVVLGVVIVVKETLYRLVRRAAEESGSTAAHTDAWHHRVDAITSVAAAIGISLSVFAGWARADGAAALLGGAIIIVNGLLLVRRPINELMDRVPDGLSERARGVASGVAGVVLVQKVQARQNGTRYFLDMHVWVDGAMSVRDAHVVAHRVKDAVREAMPRVADVLVHVEPSAEGRGP